jgi:hypothetical protein
LSYLNYTLSDEAWEEIRAAFCATNDTRSQHEKSLACATTKRRACPAFCCVGGYAGFDSGASALLFRRSRTL